MFHDLITSIKTGLREWRRLRWLKQRRASIRSPF
jgi:hypothetical protein